MSSTILESLAFIMFNTYGVWLNPNVQVFDKRSYLTDEKHINYFPWLYTSHTNQIVHNIFKVCNKHTMFKLQRARIQNTICSLHFWHTCNLGTKSMSSNLQWQCRSKARLQPCKVWKTSLKAKKPMLKFLSNKKTCQLSPLNMCKSEKQRNIHFLLYLLNSPTKF